MNAEPIPVIFGPSGRVEQPLHPELYHAIQMFDAVVRRHGLAFELTCPVCDRQRRDPYVRAGPDGKGNNRFGGEYSMACSHARWVMRYEQT